MEVLFRRKILGLFVDGIMKNRKRRICIPPYGLFLVLFNFRGRRQRFWLELWVRKVKREGRVWRGPYLAGIRIIFSLLYTVTWISLDRSALWFPRKIMLSLLEKKSLNEGYSYLIYSLPIVYSMNITVNWTKKSTILFVSSPTLFLRNNAVVAMVLISVTTTSHI